MEQREKEKKITFSEEIDSSISGFALVITFIIVGVFLIFNKNYFNVIRNSRNCFNSSTNIASGKGFMNFSTILFQNVGL